MQGPGVDRVDEVPDTLKTAISATTIVEIRKVKSALLLPFHGKKIDRDSAENALEGLNFINLEIDDYHHQVGAELIEVYASLAPRCSNATINLEVVRQFQLIMERFDSHWSEHDVQLVTNTLRAMTDGDFSTRSKVYQSAVALLKNMSRNKSLVSRKLHSIPLECLKEIQGFSKVMRIRGKDDVDYKTESASLRTMLGGAEEEGSTKFAYYIDRMVELAEASGERARTLEQELEDIDYEHDIA